MDRRTLDSITMLLRKTKDLALEIENVQKRITLLLDPENRQLRELEKLQHSHHH